MFYRICFFVISSRQPPHLSYASDRPPGVTSDHDYIVGRWGPDRRGRTAGELGHRRRPTLVLSGQWLGGGVGLELLNDGDRSDVGIGATFGYLAGLSTFEHVTVFVEPEGGLYVLTPEICVNASDGGHCVIACRPSSYSSGVL